MTYGPQRTMLVKCNASTHHAWFPLGEDCPDCPPLYVTSTHVRLFRVAHTDEWRVGQTIARDGAEWTIINVLKSKGSVEAVLSGMISRAR